MNLGSKERLVVGAIGGVGVLALIAVDLDSWRWAISSVVVLQMLTAALALVVPRRVKVRKPKLPPNAVLNVAQNNEALLRIERAIENVSLRIVTESQATQQEMTGRIDKGASALSRELKRFSARLDRGGDEDVREVEALIQLFARIQPRAAMPSSGRWALDPTGLLQLVDLVERIKPRVVVDLGSGTSTVWLAYALEIAGVGRLIAVDHDEHYAKETRRTLANHGFTDASKVEVRLAPLAEGDLPGHTTPWYSTDVLDDIEGVDILVVDGPPQATGPVARYPAVGFFADKFAPNAFVVMDDFNREQEKAIVVRWSEEHPSLVPYVGASAGQRQAVLRFGDSA
ncbi:MAG: class I SAM-dependent methyltransferase [Aeromicrobium sp.]